MNFREMMKTESQCIEEHAPQCQASCPLHIDNREIIRCIKAGNISEAGEIFYKQSFFPRLIAKTCHAPCEHKCKRTEVDEAVAINQLEQFLLSQCQFPKNTIVPYMELKQKVAIIGGGISSMAAAWYLLEKGFKITVFESSGRLGGKAAAFPGVTPEDIEADFAALLSSAIEFRLNTEIGKDIPWSDIIADFDCLYVGGNLNLADLDLPKSESGLVVDAVTLQVGDSKIFAGGSGIRGQENFSGATWLSDGRRSGISIDRFLKNVSLTAARKQEIPYQSQLYTVVDNKEKIMRQQPQGSVFTAQEGLTAANRCLDCRCMECVKQCKYLAKYGKYPRKYIREIANTISLLGGGLRSGRKLVMSCTLCGLCSEICPNSIPMAEISLSGRKEMSKKSELPPAFYDFPVRDMQFANSDASSFYRHQPEMNSSKYLFFPGCQMAASTPEYIAPVYRHLTDKLADGVGLFLGCCGAPADWSGRESLFNETMAELIKTWEEMGKPILIAACTTCIQQFSSACPEMEIKSLWEIFADNGLPQVGKHRHGNFKKVAVHDPCTSRYNSDIHEYIREILLMCDYEVEELEYSRDKTKCCGYGGLVFYGNKSMAHDMVQARVQESSLDYVVYCSVCRDYFVKAGKPTYHILDIIFGNDNADRLKELGPNISQKEYNRAVLKQDLLKEFWQEDVTMPETINLLIDDHLMEILEDRLITVANIKMVIAEAENSKNRLIRPSDGHYIASCRPGIITYWVEYQPNGDGYQVYNAYSHRIQIIDK